MSLLVVQTTPAKRAVELVRTILSSNNSGLSTQEIFKLVAKHDAPAAAAPASSAPKPQGFQAKAEPTAVKPVIPSVRYLKTVVLPHMARIQDVEKFHTKRGLSNEEVQQRLATMSKAVRKSKADSLLTSSDAWLWRIRTMKDIPPKPKKEPKVFGTEVGVGEDWSHLNKRRQRAREGKVTRDVVWMKDVETLRKSHAALSIEAKV